MYGSDVMCGQGEMVLVDNRHGPVWNCCDGRQDQAFGRARMQQPVDVEGSEGEDEGVDKTIAISENAAAPAVSDGVIASAVRKRP